MGEASDWEQQKNDVFQCSRYCAFSGMTSSRAGFRWLLLL